MIVGQIKLSSDNSFINSNEHFISSPLNAILSIPYSHQISPPLNFRKLKGANWPPKLGEGRKLKGENWEPKIGGAKIKGSELLTELITLGYPF